jgi:hypothetical protein
MHANWIGNNDYRSPNTTLLGNKEKDRSGTAFGFFFCFTKN